MFCMGKPYYQYYTSYSSQLLHTFIPLNLGRMKALNVSKLRMGWLLQRRDETKVHLSAVLHGRVKKQPAADNRSTTTAHACMTHGSPDNPKIPG